MTRLLLILFLPLSCLAQFGSFTHDQPYLAQDYSSTPAGCTPYTLTQVSNVSGMIMWVRADTGVYNDNGTTPAADGDTVYLWKDCSPNGNDLIQSDAGLRPMYHTAQVNGLPSIGFTNKIMDRIYSSPLTKTNTYFIVYQISTGAASPGYVFDGASGAYQDAYAVNGSAMQMINDGNFFVSVWPNPFPRDTWFYDTLFFSGPESTGWASGVPLGTTNGTSGLVLKAPANIRFGNNYFPDQPGKFKIAEFLIFGGYLDWTTAGGISCYLKNKYGL